jgi:hypothetical protein
MDVVSFVALGEKIVPPMVRTTRRAAALLAWLGFAPDTFASLPSAEVRARCMRRLWHVRRNFVPLREDVQTLFALADAAGKDGFVLVG